MGFPRVFHQIWISRDGQPIPANWLRAHTSWLNLHPTWGHHLWNDTSCRELIATGYDWFLAQWDRYASPIQHADVCRYFVLHHYGGLYADLDIRPLSNLDAALIEAENASKEVLFLEKEHGIFLTPTVSIGLMASVARSPFWLGVVAVLQDRGDRWFYRFSHHLQIIYGTGPLVAKTQIRSWNASAVGLFSAEYFYACDVCQPLPCHRSGGMVVFEPGGLIWNQADTKVINFFDCKILRPMLNPAVLCVLLAVLWLLWHLPAVLRVLRVLHRPHAITERVRAIPRATGRVLAAACARFSWRQKAVMLLLCTSFVANLTPLLILYRSSGQDLCRRGNRVLLVTAYPEDQAWFFLPTIEACRSTSDLHLLCLSSGHGAGKGKRRGEDLRAAAGALGFHTVHVVNDTDLGRDSDLLWDATAIATAVEQVAVLHDISAVVSFDQRGVNAQPSHRAVYDGIRQAQYSESLRGRRFYQLQTVGLLRRYASVVDIPISVLTAFDSEMYVSWVPSRGLRALGLASPGWRWHRGLLLVLNRYTYLNTIELMPDAQPTSRYIHPLRNGMV